MKKSLTYEDYVHCLFENAVISREQCNIRSRLHVLRSEKERKIALSPNDDKRYLRQGETDTLPWGHYEIFDDEMISLIEEMDLVSKRLLEEVEGARKRPRVEGIAGGGDGCDGI